MISRDELRRQVLEMADQYPDDKKVKVVSEKLSDGSFAYNVILTEFNNSFEISAIDFESAKHIAETIARNTVDVFYDDDSWQEEGTGITGINY